jgi:hypothetical protein
VNVEQTLVIERITPRCVVNESSGCWEWQGARNGGGYGTIHFEGGTKYIHRLVAASAYGPIPDGLQVDHLCRNRICCRPDHLELVTQRTNLLRGESFTGIASRRTHCAAGHEYTPDNTGLRADNGTRVCRTCHRERSRRYARDARKSG